MTVHKAAGPTPHGATRSGDPRSAFGEQRAADEARVGTLLDAKWQLDSLLGRGGMATVYAATHRSTRARAAVKVLHLELVHDLDVREGFSREARVASDIEHPARVTVLDEGRSDFGEMFLVMDLLDGATLDAHLRRDDGPTSLDEHRRILGPVLELLGECHAAGIVHRDIKPANIFLTTSGQVKVLDFGVARLRESAVDPARPGAILGTPAFMAPEQALGLSDLVDGRADLWSVGACLYTMLSGQRVHRARSEHEAMRIAATKTAPSIAVVMPDLAPEVVAFVDQALAHDRSNRFPDAATMLAALAALQRAPLPRPRPRETPRVTAAWASPQAALPHSAARMPSSAPSAPRASVGIPSSASRSTGAIPSSAPRASEAVPSSVPTSSSPGSSTPPRKRRSFEDLPKAFDPRAEPEDRPRARAIVPPDVASRPTLESLRAERPPPGARQNSITTQPEMAAVVSPPDVHERRTLPPEATATPARRRLDAEAYEDIVDGDDS